MQEETSGIGLVREPPRQLRAQASVAAIIVTYFPRRAVLSALLDGISGQVDRVVVVDNTPEEVARAELGCFASPRCDVIFNGANYGLAAAQNLGIRRARELGCSHVLLLDQDSLPARQMVARLLDALWHLQASGVRVAAVGPRWQDRHTGQSAPFVRIGRLGLQKVPCADGVQGTIECDTLIASGCLIPLHSVDAIGPMDERLFIDQIDTEWGLRAQARGYRLYGVCDAILFHAIGEASVPAWFAKTRRVSVHAPVRDYYLFRNAITIFFRRKAPWRWRIVQGTRLAGLFIVLTIQVPPRRERLRMILRGIFDALRGQLGPIEVTPAHVR